MHAHLDFKTVLGGMEQQPEPGKCACQSKLSYCVSALSAPKHDIISVIVDIRFITKIKLF